MNKLLKLPIYSFLVFFGVLHFLLLYLLYFPIKSNAIDFDEAQATVFLGFVVYTFLFNFLSHILKVTIFFLIILAVNIILESKVNWGNVLRLLILCQLTFLLPLLVKDVWFLFIDTNYSTENIKSFKGINFSILANFYDEKQDISFFFDKMTFIELVYAFIFFLLFTKLLKGKKEIEILLFCGVSYGTYWFFYLIAIMYFMIFFV